MAIDKQDAILCIFNLYNHGNCKFSVLPMNTLKYNIMLTYCVVYY